MLFYLFYFFLCPINFLFLICYCFKTFFIINDCLSPFLKLGSRWLLILFIDRSFVNLNWNEMFYLWIVMTFKHFKYFPFCYLIYLITFDLYFWFIYIVKVIYLICFSDYLLFFMIFTCYYINYWIEHFSIRKWSNYHLKQVD